MENNIIITKNGKDIIVEIKFVNNTLLVILLKCHGIVGSSELVVFALLLSE